MVSIVLDHLRTTATDEYIFLTSEILSLLNENGYETHTDSYDDLVYSFEQENGMLFNDAVEAKHKLVLTSVCADFGVTVETEATTKELFKLASALLLIESYDDAAAINDVCNGDFDVVEKLAIILSYVSSEPSEYFMPLISHINDGVIARIKDTHKEGKVLVDYAKRDEYVGALNKVCSMLGTKDFYIVTELINGLNVGFEMKVYLDMIAGKINTADSKRIAKELLCISVISSDVQKESLATIRSILPLYIHDEMKYAAIDNEYNRLLLEYSK